MNDLISRKAAIKAIRKDMYADKDFMSAMICEGIEDVLNGLPSAEPEIIRCKDCKNSEHWYRDRRRCFLWSEDGVSVFDDGFCNYAERKQDA